MTDRNQTPAMEQAFNDPLVKFYALQLHMNVDRIKPFISDPDSYRFVRLTTFSSLSLLAARKQVDDYALRKTQYGTVQPVHYAIAKDILNRDHGLYVSPRLRILGELTRMICADKTVYYHFTSQRQTASRGDFLDYCKHREVKL